MCRSWSQLSISLVLLASLLAVKAALGDDVPQHSAVHSPGTFNIVDYGAKPDGKTLATAAIQKAIDACTQSGGGRVVVPAGTFLTTTVELRDHVTLELQAGATLLGSSQIEDYTARHLVVADSARNIGLIGPGTIDGRGPSFWQKRAEIRASRQKFSWIPAFAYEHPAKPPGGIVRLVGCSDVRITDITLKNSESWTVHLLGCADVQVRGLRIRNPLHGPNTDGIDLEACRNVLISDCDIFTGDDAICLKNTAASHNHLSCRDITVTNCIITTTCNGFKIGTGTIGDFENIVFGNSIIRAAAEDDPLVKESLPTLDPAHHGNALGPISGVAIETVDGGDVRGVAVSNLVMRGVRTPIFVRLGNRGGRDRPKRKDPKPGTLAGINISNVVAYDAATACSITGIADHRVKNVSLSNIQITTAGGGPAELAAKELPERESSYPEATMWGPMPVYGFFCRHVEGLRMRDVRVDCQQPDARPLLACDDVVDARFAGLGTKAAGEREATIRLHNVRDLTLGEFDFSRAERCWVELTGAQTRNVALTMEIPASNGPGDEKSGRLGDLLRVDKSVPSEAVSVYLLRPATPGE